MVAASPQVLKKRGAAGAAGCVEGLCSLALRGRIAALRAMIIKSALRIHLSVSYGMIGILLIGSLRGSPLSGYAGLPPLAGVAKELDS